MSIPNVFATRATNHLATGMSGWLFEARKGRQGLLLSARGLADAEIVGAKLPRSAFTSKVVPGRGILVGALDELVQIQVPAP